MTSTSHELDVDDSVSEPFFKKRKIDEDSTLLENILPPSHTLLNIGAPCFNSDGVIQIREEDVGISEYLRRDIPIIKGIIKQRFTDFLVYEVDQDHNVVHIKSLDPPVSTNEKRPDSMVLSEASIEQATYPEEVIPEPESHDPWPETFNAKLSQYLDMESIASLRQMLMEGPEPPRVSDAGWASREMKKDIGEQPGSRSPAAAGKRGRGRGTSRGGKQGRPEKDGGDQRKVLSNPIPEKSTRTALHQLIRELFKGKFESETDTANTSKAQSEEGSRIAIRWAKNGSRGGSTSGRGGARVAGRRDRGDYPPYIHFTLQKTNRDTQDALGHLARSLHMSVKDLSVAGTKDKRGVTTQRVAFRRGNKSVEDVWKNLNGINKYKSAKDAVSKRGDRGIRIADLKYRKAGLELGMLKGNAFFITLRNIQVDSMDTVDQAMNILKTYGFINYYGMQRFGTAAIPTHSIGLAILKSDWHLAVSLIMCQRPGEHPDVVKAREAWLLHGDYERALELMPRRVVAERCILESYKTQKGETRNAMGALATIPRGLRMMYVHAYQSYVWNAIVSERIRIHGFEKPVAGDLVYESLSSHADPSTHTVTDDDLDEEDLTADMIKDKSTPMSNRKIKKARVWVAPKVKVLTQADIENGTYSMLDVLMPLPGTDVAYPGGFLGEKYQAFLRADGLDPENFERKQKEYTLGGSYRKILQIPKNLSWCTVRYTDPDVALAQADEDKLLGFDPPAIVPDGKFLALQIEIQLEAAAYATMALRQVTKQETGSRFQADLTQASEDQKHKGASFVDPVDDVATGGS